ncbi:hypothetical protein [Salipiger mucosus]|uniref:Uncharacterized protein n=1 Tax=Salipiger mucosus DSM 16094 TaxID=1123237 RepID=S9R0D1_9RHOB|nr:hypothetical protein [Salipiger mucosus]EPX85393.1 hypothetical protein Salmuc_02773 [Salipiger mucosus DSM 16094]
MSVESKWIDKVNDLDNQVADLGNLVEALQLVCEQWCGTPLERGSEQDRVRSAVVGLAKAMEERASQL